MRQIPPSPHFPTPTRHTPHRTHPLFWSLTPRQRGGKRASVVPRPSRYVHYPTQPLLLAPLTNFTVRKRLHILSLHFFLSSLTNIAAVIDDLRGCDAHFILLHANVRLTSASFHTPGLSRGTRGALKRFVSSALAGDNTRLLRLLPPPPVRTVANEQLLAPQVFSPYELATSTHAVPSSPSSLLFPPLLLHCTHPSSFRGT